MYGVSWKKKATVRSPKPENIIRSVLLLRGSDPLVEPSTVVFSDPLSWSSSARK